MTSQPLKLRLFALTSESGHVSHTQTFELISGKSDGMSGMGRDAGSEFLSAAGGVWDWALMWGTSARAQRIGKLLGGSWACWGWGVGAGNRAAVGASAGTAVTASREP